MILLIGGTGFLGSLVFAQLNANKYPIRVFTRGVSDWRNNSLKKIRDLGAEVFMADIRDPNRLEKAIEGCSAVINLSGLMRANPQDSYYETHVESIKHLVQLSQKYAVQRVVHVSCLGSSEHSNSEYYRTKAQGESLIRSGNFYWTIFRPSFMFGESFVLFDLLLPMIKSLPFMPIIGGGLNRIRPVWVEDVASCIFQCVYDKDTAGITYDLAGPKAYTLSELMQIISARQSRKKHAFDVTSNISLKVMKLYQKFNPDAFMTEDLIQILTSDSDGCPELMQSTFKVRMRSLDESLDRLLMGA